MPRRNVRLDHKGKRRNPLSDAGRAYLLVRIAAPTMPHSHAAHAVAIHGDAIMYMSDEEMRAAIEGASEAWKAASDQERTEASWRANKWESNPETQSHLRLYQGRAMTRAGMSFKAWTDLVQDDRTFARKQRNPGVAHEATRTLGKALGHLEKEAQANTNTTFNVNGDVQVIQAVMRDPDARARLDALAERLAVLSGGDGGEVVAGPMVES